METFLRDLKHSCRMFLQRPGFTFTAIAVLALGIGLNTAMFSVINTVLLKPLHAPDPERVVIFLSTSSQGSTSDASEIKFNIWREQAAVLQDVSGYYMGTVNLTGVDQPQRAIAIYVTGDYFHLFGLSPAQGRGFITEEEQVNGPKVAILSNEFWNRAFGGDPQIIGKTISLNGGSYGVVGVMPPGVQTETPDSVDVWLPFAIDPNSSFQAHYFKALGRLKPGLSLAAVNAQLELVTHEFRRKFPNTVSSSRGDVFSVALMEHVLVQDARSSLLVLSGSVFLVLLIACANVANLLLVRATGRTGEIAVRLALGASRMRIIRQMLTEGALLSIVGGIIGLILGFITIHFLLGLNAARIPRIGANGANVMLDWRVLLFTLGVSLLTSILFGLFPAIKASGADLNSHLREAIGRGGTGLSGNRTRSLLVVSEMSLALLLLIGAALLIRTFIALRSVNPGFQTQNIVTTQTLLDPHAGGKAGVNEIVDDAIRRISAISGVKSVGYTKYLPLSGAFSSLPIIIVGRPLNGPSHGVARWMVNSPSYFEILHIPLVRGRFFTEADRLDTPLVAIVNQTMARQLWKDGDPIGDQILIGKGLGPNFAEGPRQIVGIVGDVLDSGLSEPSQPTVYIPGAQLSDARTTGKPVSWVISTKGPSNALNTIILRELGQATGEPVSPVIAMDEVKYKSTARQELSMLLMSIFGGAALLLAAIGIYGLLAYTVRQRTREIGVRMALGARSVDVRNMVLSQGMRLATIGIAVGIVAATVLTRFLSGFLFGVKALDPFVFIFVPVLLATVALVAIWLPANRASRVEPTTALRYE